LMGEDVPDWGASFLGHQGCGGCLYLAVLIFLMWGGLNLAHGNYI